VQRWFGPLSASVKQNAEMKWRNLCMSQRAPLSVILWCHWCKVFDCLWSVFAVSMSATRIVEAAHGFQRESWDPQRPMERNDAQLSYITRIEFKARQGKSAG
jgi:hypothetical protein